MNQLTGVIKAITPIRGYRPALDIQVEILNPDEQQVAFTWMSGRVSISFSPSTKATPSRGDALDLGFAAPRYTLPQFRKSTVTNFLLPLDDGIVTDLEKARTGSNVILYVTINFSAIVSAPQVVSLLQQLSTGTVADPSYGGQDIVRVIPSSEWQEIVDGLHIAEIDRRKQIDEYANQGKRALDELNATLRSAKDAAALLGIVEHAKFFEQEALEHKAGARWWLVATLVIAVVAGVAATWNFVTAESLVRHSARSDLHNVNTVDAKPDLGLEIHATIARIIVLSILLSAAIWTGRVYKAHRHNFVVNRHRGNALSTFQTFAGGASDPQTKNAVLIQATTCIFSPQNTGYITSDKDSEGYPQILEIIRGVGNSTKRN